MKDMADNRAAYDDLAVAAIMASVAEYSVALRFSSHLDIGDYGPTF